MRILRPAVLIAILAISCSAAWPVTQAVCTFTTFAAPAGYTITMVNGVDDVGTVVGQLENSSTYALVAFSRTAAGKFTLYTAPSSNMTWFQRRENAVNVGSYQDNKIPPAVHGFTLQSGAFSAVNYPNALDTWLTEINQYGTLVGNYLKGSVSKGFVLANGKYTTIAHSGAVSTNPQAISGTGVVVGYYTDTATHGFTWKNGSFTTVDNPKGVYGTMLTDVNGSGVVVGNYLSGDHAFGFIYKNKSFANVVYSGAKAASVGGINSTGVIAGQLFFTAKNQPGYTAVCQ